MIDPLVVFIPTALYGLAVLASLFDVWRTDRVARWIALVSVLLAVLTRLFLYIEPGICPMTAGSSLGVVGLFLALHYVAGFHRSAPDGVKSSLLLFIALGFELISQIAAPSSAPFSPPPTQRALGELHGGLVLLSYSAFTIAAVYSFLYLVLYRLMKRRRLSGFWFSRLPSLQRLESKTATSNIIGLSALSIGLAIGLYSFAVFRGGVPVGEVKFVVAVLVWLVFLVEAVLRRGFQFSGIRIMWLPLAGAVTLFLLYNVSGGHPFWSPA